MAENANGISFLTRYVNWRGDVLYDFFFSCVKGVEAKDKHLTCHFLLSQKSSNLAANQVEEVHCSTSSNQAANSKKYTIFSSNKSRNMLRVNLPQERTEEK